MSVDDVTGDHGDRGGQGDMEDYHQQYYYENHDLVSESGGGGGGGWGRNRSYGLDNIVSFLTCLCPRLRGAIAMKSSTCIDGGRLVFCLRALNISLPRPDI